MSTGSQGESGDQDGVAGLQSYRPWPNQLLLVEVTVMDVQHSLNRTADAMLMHACGRYVALDCVDLS